MRSAIGDKIPNYIQERNILRANAKATHTAPRTDLELQPNESIGRAPFVDKANRETVVVPVNPSVETNLLLRKQNQIIEAEDKRPAITDSEDKDDRRIVLSKLHSQ